MINLLLLSDDKNYPIPSVIRHNQFADLKARKLQNQPSDPDTIILDCKGLGLVIGSKSELQNIVNADRLQSINSNLSTNKKELNKEVYDHHKSIVDKALNSYQELQKTFPKKSTASDFSGVIVNNIHIAITKSAIKSMQKRSWNESIDRLYKGYNLPFSFNDLSQSVVEKLLNDFGRKYLVVNGNLYFLLSDYILELFRFVWNIIYKNQTKDNTKTLYCDIYDQNDKIVSILDIKGLASITDIDILESKTAIFEFIEYIRRNDKAKFIDRDITVLKKLLSGYNLKDLQDLLKLSNTPIRQSRERLKRLYHSFEMTYLK